MIALQQMGGIELLCFIQDNSNNYNSKSSRNTYYLSGNIPSVLIYTYMHTYIGVILILYMEK